MVSTETNSSHVPGQFLGFSLQVTRFAYRLMTSSPDCFVSLEVFEDVGVEYPNGNKRGEQDKSVTSEHNPIADHSVDFWKTISNWGDAARNGDLPPESSLFGIYVSKYVEGNISLKFSNAKSIEEAEEAIAYAKMIFWGDAPDFSKREKISPPLAKYINNVFNSDENSLCKIIMNFTLEFGSGSPQTDLRKLFEDSPFVPPEIADDVFLHFQGWVKGKIDEYIEKGQPAIIGFNSAKNEITTYVRKVDNRIILRSYARSANPEEIASSLLKTYIRQLELIESDQEQKICAINEFICASIDRTEWARRGLVNHSSYKELEDKLKNTWNNTKRKILIREAQKCDVVKGQLLLLDCLSYETDLEGLPLPTNFIRGSFHVLSENQDIGWHPDYINLLRKISNDGS